MHVTARIRSAVSVERWAERLSTDATGALAKDFADVLQVTPRDPGKTIANRAQPLPFSAKQSAPFDAFHFETRGASASTAGKPFEFVLVNATSLCKNGAEPNAFSEQFDSDPDPRHPTVCTFESPGGDALLLAPRATQEFDRKAYCSIASFVRSPAGEVVELLQKVAEEYSKRLRKKKTVWLSTSGMGVAWLHFRLDSRPKYYTYEPFANDI